MLEALPAPAEIGYILHLSNVQMQPGQINIDSNCESYFWGMMSSARERDRDRQTDIHTHSREERHNRILNKPPPPGLLSRAAGGGDEDYGERLQSCEHETFSIIETFQALAVFDQVYRELVRQKFKNTLQSLDRFIVSGGNYARIFGFEEFQLGAKENLGILTKF